jgi:nucleotide sugar dehydrogenase
MMHITQNTVAVVGLGYVGLPLAVHAAEKGYTVVGVDRNEHLVSQINARQTPFANDERFKLALEAASSERFTATTDMSAIEAATTIVICVPTPTNDNVPDLSLVIGAAEEIAVHLQPGQLVILESTVNPGITRDAVLPTLEKISGLRCGEGFFLAHCPERIDPGNPTFYVGNLNRVVGGITLECTKRAHDFYASIIDGQIIELASSEEAEFVKSWENSHRNVLIALANEAAVICDAIGMDVNNIIKGLQSKVDQFGLKLAQPGIGPGGHCIPEDIHYVIEKARQQGVDTRFLDSAADLNDKMPKYAIGQLQNMISDNGEQLRNLHFTILGLAYKENIEDARRSPAIDVAHLLVQRAKSVTLHDPYVNMEIVMINGALKQPDLDAALASADAIFVATAHDVYKQIDANKLKEHGIRYVYDGRNCFDPYAISAADISYKGVGRQQPITNT